MFFFIILYFQFQIFFVPNFFLYALKLRKECPLKAIAQAVTFSNLFKVVTFSLNHELRPQKVVLRRLLEKLAGTRADRMAFAKYRNICFPYSPPFKFAQESRTLRK